MTGEFTGNCNDYYRLKVKLTEQDLHLMDLIKNAIPYKKQIQLTDLDEVLSCNRAILAAREKLGKTYARLVKAGENILKLMEYFEIPLGKVLVGEIPGELEYHIWVDEEGWIGIRKTKDLTPEPLPSNFIVITPCSWDDEED